MLPDKAQERRRRAAKKEDERPADLELWTGDGQGAPCPARQGKPASVQVSIGRTDSERALGFSIHDGKTINFVLNRAQVETLLHFCRYQILRIKRGGTVNPMIKFVADLIERRIGSGGRRRRDMAPGDKAR